MSSLTLKRLPAAGCRMNTRTKGSQHGHHHDQHRRALLTSPGSASASARPSVAPTKDVHPPPSEISAWISDLISQPTITLRDVVDRNRISHLLRTLPTRSGSAAGQSASGSSSKAKGLAIGDVGSNVENGDILPHGHHLVLFQPRTTMDKLAADGSSTEYNAPEPYNRRMWAGGSFEWSLANPLKVGSRVVEKTRVSSVDYKNNMIFVNQEKVFSQDLKEGATVRTDTGTDAGSDTDADAKWSVREMRTHVFRTDQGVKAVKRDSRPPASPAPQAPKVTSLYSMTYTPTSPLLFRFSALTFNGHKIHYDKDWTQRIENHPDLVVHGPLTAALLVEIAAMAAERKGLQLVRFDYRATHPMYVDREIRLEVNESESGQVSLVAEQSGNIGMKATAVFA